MHKVFVAWDADEAKRFVKLLRENGIQGSVLEDREFPGRGEIHDAEGAPEVWIADPAQVPLALDLAKRFESETRRPKDPAPEPDDTAP